MENLRKELTELCMKYIFDEENKPINNIINAAYIPFIPDNWDNNKILILFEAQNLSNTNEAYVKHLNNLEESGQIQRLYPEYRYKPKRKIGITPWDKGYLDFPLKVCFPEFNFSDFAVSNAVLWSLAEGKTNISPSPKTKQESSQLWNEMLKKMDPNYIITVGNIASDIIYKTDYKDKRLKTYFPYGRYPNFVNKHFDFSDHFKYYFGNDIIKFKDNLRIDSATIKATTPMAISLYQKLNLKNKKDD